jgi:hypothetical protein
MEGVVCIADVSVMEHTSIMYYSPLPDVSGWDCADMRVINYDKLP